MRFLGDHGIWIGLVLMATGLILAGVVLYRIK